MSRKLRLNELSQYARTLLLNRIQKVFHFLATFKIIFHEHSYTHTHIIIIMIMVPSFRAGLIRV